MLYCVCCPPVTMYLGAIPLLTGSLLLERDGNNVKLPANISPGYNEKMGYKNGAQNDIFQ
jgi:hypothetical protein